LAPLQIGIGSGNINAIIVVDVGAVARLAAVRQIPGV